MQHLITTIAGSLIITGLIALARWGDIKRAERKTKREEAERNK